MFQIPEIKTVYTVAHVCGGIGGGALGYEWANTEYRGAVGRFRSLYSIDVDQGACQNFENIVQAPAYCLDLFDREQYIDWHGHEPPEDWKEVTPDDIRALSNGIAPDVVFYSAPCKGFSGLLPEKTSKTKKYQALNKLYWRIVWLFLEAFPENPPAMFVSENVPRIKTRGKEWVEKVKKTAGEAGYVFHNIDHDLGMIGELAQERNRNMFVARHPEKCPVFLYHPTKKKHKKIGDVIGPLPLPGDPACGPMHQLPNLTWKVSARLAAIPPGGDWRDLEKFAHEDYRLTYQPRNGAWGVADWNKSCGTVNGAPGVGRSNTVQAVADPRAGNCSENRHVSHYHVTPWFEPAGTVTGASHVGNGRLCIEDLRLNDRGSRHPGVYAVKRWDEVGSCVTGTRVGSGAMCIEDRRLAKGYSNKHKVLEWDQVSTTITGMRDVQEGAQSVADPRIGCRPRAGTYGVMSMDQTGTTVIGSADVHTSSVAVADDRDDAWLHTYGSKMTKANLRKMRRSLVRDRYLGVNVETQPAPPHSTVNLAATLREAIDHVYQRDAAGYFRVPDMDEQGVWVILSAHGGGWHRPLTTYELAMIQSYPTHLPDGRPFQLVGSNSDAQHREWIGNSVPPKASQAIAESMLLSLMASSAGETWMMSGEEIWVLPDLIEIGDPEPEPSLVH